MSVTIGLVWIVSALTAFSVPEKKKTVSDMCLSNPINITHYICSSSIGLFNVIVLTISFLFYQMHTNKFSDLAFVF